MSERRFSLDVNSCVCAHDTTTTHKERHDRAPLQDTNPLRNTHSCFQHPTGTATGHKNRNHGYAHPRASILWWRKTTTRISGGGNRPRRHTALARRAHWTQRLTYICSSQEEGRKDGAGRLPGGPVYAFPTHSVRHGKMKLTHRSARFMGRRDGCAAAAFGFRFWIQR